MAQAKAALRCISRGAQAVKGGANRARSACKMTSRKETKVEPIVRDINAGEANADATAPSAALGARSCTTDGVARRSSMCWLLEQEANWKEEDLEMTV